MKPSVSFLFHLIAIVSGFGWLAGACAAPVITANKDDNLAAGLRKLPGNTITYTTTISNTGDATATGVLFSDPDPANTTFVSVNSTPIARNDTYSAIGNVQITIPVGSGVLVNDSDPDDSVNGVGTLTVSASPATTTGGGNLSVAANGGFTYNPAPGFTGADTFTYTLTDSEGSTDTATVTINVTGTIWFINAASGAGGDGRLTAPFNTVAAFNSTAADDPGDNIFLFSGSYPSTIVLLANQRLIGQGATSTLQTITGLTPPTGSLTFPSTGGTRPTIAIGAGTGVTLGSGNSVLGLNVTNSAGHGITGSAVGTLTLADFDVTVTGGSALSLTTSGTVTATGTNNLNSTTGTALNVNAVTIAAAGITFKSISSGNNTAAADPASGIILNGTGAGGLTVTGDGGASNNGSGGVIQNSTGVGISLTTTGPISFGYMNVANSATDGIRGSGINGFTLNRCNITDNPTGGATDDGVDLSNLSGALAITNCLVDKAPHNDVQVDNFNTNMTSFTMTGTTLSNDPPNNPLGNDGVLLTMRGNSVLPSGNIQSNTFAGMRAVAVQIQTNDSGRIGVNSGTVSTTTLTAANSIIVQNNTFTGNGQGIDIATSQVSNLTFQVLNNTINGKVTAPNAVANTASSHAINAFTAAGADTGPAIHSFVGKIDGNIIGTQGVKDSGSGFGSGVRAVVQGQTTQGVVTINNNTIREVPNATIINIIGQNGAAAAGTATARFKITNNTMPAPSGSNLALCGLANTACADTGIFVLADEGTTVTAVITGNTIYDLSTMNGSFDIYLAERIGPPAGAQLRIEGTGSVSAFTLANNALAGANKFVDEGAGSGTPSSLVAPGSLGGYPLLFAPGGVNAAKFSASGVVLDGVEAGNSSASSGIEIPNCPCGCKARVRAALAAARAAEQAKTAVQADASGGTPVLPIRALTQPDLDSLVAAARERWTASGLTGEQLAILRSVKFEVADLPGWYLGEADGDRIRVDNNAGGNGWFIGAAAEDDAQFAKSISATRRYTDPASSPAGRIDLLTTILHEMGHALGLDDTYAQEDRDNLMYGFLPKGERRLPAKNQAVGATPHAEATPHFLGTPLNIGDLPAGKTVTITYVVSINAGTTAISTSSQGTVSGSNFANKVTNDPQTGTTDDATVTPIHQPPVVTNVAVATNEDTTLTFTAANFTASFSDPNGDILTSVRITSLPANGVLKVGAATVASVPTDVAIASIGTLTFVPTGNFNGASSFGWNGFDGTLYGVSGATVNITVNVVNDVPSFTKGPDQTVLEDAAAQTLVGWATALSAGPADEAGQALNFIVGNNNPALFSLQPAIAANGTLTYTPAANANGSATVTVQIHDNGGVLNGGVDTSAAQTFTINVAAVNDAPGFTRGADQTVLEDAGAQTVATWATALSAGPADEVAQVLNFIVSNNNNALFSAQPAVAANGTLTYTPAANANGSATVTVQIHDNGGVLNGGGDTSVAQTFTINVTSVNDAPSFTKGANQTVNEDAGAQTGAGWATALSAGPANEVAQTLNFIVGNNNPALFSLQPAIAANGTLTYTPAANANGSATVTVQIHDNGGTANGGGDTSAPQSFTITVTAVNDAPSITAQVPIALAQNHSRTIVFTDLTVTDPDNTYPTGFTLTVQNGANYTHVGNIITPTPGFVGTLGVGVQVNDGAANSNVFNLVVTVNPNAEQVATNATIAPEPGGGFRVSFLGAPGASYTIQFTNSLAPANWQTLGTVAAGSNGRYSMVDIPPANTPMRFYRSTEPYLNDFGNGLGPVTLRGSAVLTNSAMKLTDEVTGGSGAVVFEGLVPGPTLNGFTARFNLAIGPIVSGVPADGVNFAVGNLGVGPWGEGGPGTANSLAVGFDTYSNGPANDNIGIHVWVNGTHLTASATDPYTNGATVPVEISYDTVNGLTVRFNSVLIFTNLPIAGFSFPATDGRFGISARTGGFTERAVVDDVEITPR